MESQLDRVFMNKRPGIFHVNCNLQEDADTERMKKMAGTWKAKPQSPKHLLLTRQNDHRSCNLVDTAKGQAVIPELVKEVKEVLGLVYPTAATQINATVEIGSEPACMQVTIKSSLGAAGPAPPGITYNTIAYHDKQQQWTYKKELEATCACGKPICRTEYMSTLRHTANAHAAEVYLASISAAPVSNLLNGMPDPHATATPCQEICKLWEANCAFDITIDEKAKVAAGMVAAAIAGYSVRGQYHLGLNDELALAFDDMGKAILEDESLFPVTAFVRPARGANIHQPGSEEELSKMPTWVQSASAIPLTPWCLSQPWYLQFTASRDHPGVQGADMCLPARRAASRVRSEFADMDAYDSLAYEDQASAIPPKVTPEAVTEKLAALLHRTGDWRTPEQFVQRLGITLVQFADLVNLREIGSLAIDMCCRCGIFVLDGQPAVACEYCVDVYHMQCQGLKSIPDGDWVCPGCTLAAGATGKAAQAAIGMARSKGSKGLARDRNKATKLMATSPRGKDPAAAPAAKPGARGAKESPMGKGPRPGSASTLVKSNSSNGLAAAGGLPLAPPTLSSDGMAGDQLLSTTPAPPSLTPAGSSLAAAAPTTTTSDPQVKHEAGRSDDGELTEDEQPVKRARMSNSAMSRRQSANNTAGAGAGSSRSRSNLPRPPPADAGLYTTNSPGMPNPGADGRALVLRIATTMLNRHFAPISNKWRVQTMVLNNMLAGVNCEYHQAHGVPHGSLPQVLSEATLVHGGIRCNRHKLHKGGADAGSEAGDDMQVDGGDSGNLLAPVIGGMATCSQVFRKLSDFEKHLRPNGPGAAAHIWLPKHRMYLAGFDGSKGLVELAAEEANRNHTLSEALASATHWANEARKRAVDEGRDPDASDDDSSGPMPPPQARGAMSQRQRAVHSANEQRKTRAPSMPEPLPVLAPPKRGFAAMREVSPALAGFDQASVQRQQERVRQLMAVKLSETRVLAQLPKPDDAPTPGPDGEATPAASSSKQPPLMQLVMISGTGQYLLAPLEAVEAAKQLQKPEDQKTEASSGNGAGYEARPDTPGVTTCHVPGVPVLPPAALPLLQAAGSTIVHVEQPQGTDVDEAGDGQGQEQGSSGLATTTPGSAAKVASLKLMRRFNALAGCCTVQGSPEVEVLTGLKACRESASAVPDPQLQLESMGYTEDLVAQLEVIMGVASPPGTSAGNSAPETVSGEARAAKLAALLKDVHDLRKQLEEWGSKAT